MQRNTLLEMSSRIFHAFARVTINKANADPMWQELHVDGMNSDSRNKVEHLQSYGFTATILPRDGNQGSQPKAGEGETPKGPAAEGVAVFLGGQRNHPVIIGVDDRRHRPRGLQPGENAQYDDQGQMTLIKRDGVYVLSNKDVVSMRHVTKDKQPKGTAGKDFKHEGESVTAEIRVQNGAIQFLIGGQILGEVTSEGFVIGGPMSDVIRRKRVFREKDIDSAGDTPVKYAEKGWAI